jgi:hypothetical protein
VDKKVMRFDPHPGQGKLKLYSLPIIAYKISFWWFRAVRSPLPKFLGWLTPSAISAMAGAGLFFSFFSIR